MGAANLLKKGKRCITAIYKEEGKAYLVAVTAYREGNMSLDWLDIITGTDETVDEGILTKIFSADREGGEIYICGGENDFKTIEREYPNISPKEAAQSIRMEAKYSWASDHFWNYKHYDGRIRARLISHEKVKSILKPYKEEVFITGILVGENEKFTESVDIDYREFTPDSLDEKIKMLLNTVCLNINGEEKCFSPFPAWLFRWDWHRMGMIFLSAVLVILFFVGSGEYLLYRNLQEEIQEYRQQEVLLDDVYAVKGEAEEMEKKNVKMAKLLNNFKRDGLNKSGYGIMVELANVKAKGITLTEVKADKKNVEIRGRADSIRTLLSFNQQVGSMGGWINEGLKVSKSEQNDDGIIEFICKGQL